ncbi:hypothetical protein N9954_02875 [Maribacter sp.]|nr:hypothetical protein [Maribacter sp.]
MNQSKELKMKIAVVTTVLLAVLLLGIPISCQKGDVGDIVISGMVIDQHSKKGIPDLRVKVDGVTQFGFERRTEVGNTHTNTDGAFSISIKSVEDVAFYEFFANRGSSDRYTEGTDYHGELYLDSLANNKIAMLFELSKIEPLKIHLKNTDPIGDDDYVGLHFYSDTMGFQRVKSVENSGIENLKYEAPTFDDGTRTEWIGANVNAVINCNILVNEELWIIIAIRKNGKLTEITKLINGKRNTVNEIDIDY